MNETKRNEIEKVCESLTREEAIELCKKLMTENEELKEVNSSYGFISDVLFEYCAKVVIMLLHLKSKCMTLLIKELI